MDLYTSQDTMEHGYGPESRGSIPRLSRLPTPRAPNDNLKSLKPATSRDVLRNDGISKVPLLPRPSGSYQSRTVAQTPAPLGEHIRRTVRSRFGFGWSDKVPQNPRNRSPVRDALQASQASTLETTPPKSTVASYHHQNGTENASIDASAFVVDENAITKHQARHEKRRPRPSLSERTMETLSQISPSPTPSRRKSSFYDERPIRPLSRPASSVRSRPGTSLSSRPTSPSKPPFRPPGPSSPTKERPPVLLLPNLAHSNSIYTPPKALVRGGGSRIAKPLRDTRRSSSTEHADSSQRGYNSKLTIQPGCQTVKLKPTANTYKLTTKVRTAQPALSTLFTEPPESPLTGPKLDPSSLQQSPGLRRPSSWGENDLAPSTSSSTLSGQSQGSTQSGNSSATDPEPEFIRSRAAKTSAALRMTIAQAKAQAARRKIPVVSIVADDSTSDAASDALLHSDVAQMALSSSLHGNRGLLRKRVTAASTNGNLNIAGLGLKQIPDEVLQMYDTSMANWAETVDLVKFAAADNELSTIRIDAFPDWTMQELVEDETKNNLFGGLEVLDLHNNMLKSLPVGLRRLERLHTLNLNVNRLTPDTLTTIFQIQGLRELSLANNQLFGALPTEIGRMVNLQVLDLHGNGLEVLSKSLSGLEKLKVLNVSYNKLSSLPFEWLATSSVVEINATHNRLSGTLITEAVSKLESLKVLDVSFNRLESLTSNETLACPTLQALGVDGNRICNLPDISFWTALVLLTASENRLTELPSGFTDLPDLKNADFSRNNIKDVPEKVGMMENLVSINLASNPLRDRKYLTMRTDDLKADLRERFAPAGLAEDTLEPIVSILAATSELLRPAFPVCSAASKATSSYLYTPITGILDLSTAPISFVDLSTIDLTNPITTVRLSSTSLPTFPSNLLTHPSIQPHLVHLDLSHTPLSATSYLTHPLDLPSLRSLNIVSTGLTSLEAFTTHLHAPNLHSLNISVHRLTGPLPVLRQTFPNLTTLLATDNWFSSISVDAIRGLEVLDIRNNEIESLPPKIGMLGNPPSKKSHEVGKLRVFETGGNKFRVPRLAVVEKGTEAVLRDLRRMIPLDELEVEWTHEV